VCALLAFTESEDDEKNTIHPWLRHTFPTIQQ
jgi:hypothetical protein